MSIALALIGGTGLYQLPGLEVIERREIQTPYGEASSSITIGRYANKTVAFLARHGEKHSIAPHRVNYRANVWALHQLGCKAVIGINAVGGIHADMGPRVLVVPDQIIDYTHGRLTSYCDVEDAEVQHIDFSDPYSVHLRQQLIDAAQRAQILLVDGGCYGATQGPRLETRAEITRMKRDGCDLVGMTGMPEAALARELGMEYACLALVANWAAGCGDQAEISLEEIYANLAAAMNYVPNIIVALLKDEMFINN